jgi:hypothetical protein
MSLDRFNSMSGCWNKNLLAPHKSRILSACLYRWWGNWCWNSNGVTNGRFVTSQTQCGHHSSAGSDEKYVATCNKISSSRYIKITNVKITTD